MGDQIHGGVYQVEAVNIQIQILAVTGRDGKITPLWFQLETEEHEIKKESYQAGEISADEFVLKVVKGKQTLPLACLLIIIQLHFHSEVEEAHLQSDR